jgi:hypothetical protein
MDNDGSGRTSHGVAPAWVRTPAVPLTWVLRLKNLGDHVPLSRGPVFRQDPAQPGWNLP